MIRIDIYLYINEYLQHLYQSDISGKTTLFFNEYGMQKIYFLCTHTHARTHARTHAHTQPAKFDLFMIIYKGLYMIIYRRPSGKSRHVDFPLKKPTRRFFVGKGDTSIFCWKSRHVDLSLKKRTRRV